MGILFHDATVIQELLIAAAGIAFWAGLIFGYWSLITIRNKSSLPGITPALLSIAGGVASTATLNAQIFESSMMSYFAIIPIQSLLSFCLIIVLLIPLIFVHWGYKNLNKINWNSAYTRIIGKLQYIALLPIREGKVLKNAISEELDDSPDN